MPTNMVMEKNPMMASVSAAFFALGFLNAGTPLLTASTPVNAVHPEANARMARKITGHAGVGVLGGNGLSGRREQLLAATGAGSQRREHRVDP